MRKFKHKKKVSKMDVIIKTIAILMVAVMLISIGIGLYMSLRNFGYFL